MMLNDGVNTDTHWWHWLRSSHSVKSCQISKSVKNIQRQHFGNKARTLVLIGLERWSRVDKSAHSFVKCTLQSSFAIVYHMFYNFRHSQPPVSQHCQPRRRHLQQQPVFARWLSRGNQRTERTTMKFNKQTQPTHNNTHINHIKAYYRCSRYSRDQTSALIRLTTLFRTPLSTAMSENQQQRHARSLAISVCASAGPGTNAKMSTVKGRNWDPNKMFDVSPEEMRAIQERAEMRNAMRKEFQKKISNPYRGVGGYTVSALTLSDSQPSLCCGRADATAVDVNVLVLT